jgi:hypothetical protein
VSVVHLYRLSLNKVRIFIRYSFFGSFNLLKSSRDRKLFWTEANRHFAGTRFHLFSSQWFCSVIDRKRTRTRSQYVTRKQWKRDVSSTCFPCNVWVVHMCPSELDVKFHIYDILRSHGGRYRDCRLLGYGAMQFSTSTSTYRRDLLPPSSESKGFFFPENGGYRFIWNIGTYLSNYMASHSKIKQSSKII